MCVPTCQAVVALQLRVLHRAFLLVCQVGLADAGQDGGGGLAGVRVPQHATQTLHFQQRAVVLADGIAVFLILVALRALCLEVQGSFDQVRRLVLGLHHHRTALMGRVLRVARVSAAPSTGRLHDGGVQAAAHDAYRAVSLAYHSFKPALLYANPTDSIIP